MVANGVLYTATNTGVLVARNPATGAAVWSDSTIPGRSTGIYQSLVVANGAVYAARNSGVTAHHP